LLAALTLAALTLVALAESVAAAATTLAFAALAAIAPTTMTLSLIMAAIARGTRLCKGGRSRSVVGVERLRGRRGCVRAEHELL
jgi:hypothetical protein